MSLTTEGRREAFNQEGAAAWIILLRINAKDSKNTIPEIRLANNNQKVVSYLSGSRIEYDPVAFEFVLPQKTANKPPEAKLVIDNVDTRLITEVVRKITTPPIVSIEVALCRPNQTIADPLDIDNYAIAESIQLSLNNLTLRSISWNASQLTGVLFADNLLNRKWPFAKMTPTTYPGIFS